MGNLISLKSVANQIREVTLRSNMQTRLISIDGCGGAGKSTLANRLSDSLGNCPIVHTDDFASWDNPLNWYPRMIEQVLQPLQDNQLAHFQRYDWNEKRLAGWITIPKSDFIIIEGVSSSRREFRPFLSFSIFVAASADIRLHRGIERDGPEARSNWIKWMAQEDQYVERDRPDKFADLIVSGESGSGDSISVLPL